MKKKWTLPLTGLAGLAISSAAFAGTQNIVPSQEDFEVSPGDTVQFSLTYPAGNPETTGVGVQIHFDSSKLEFIGTQDVLDTSFTNVSSSPADDSTDGDADTSTDSKIVSSFGTLSGFFIDAADMPATLLTIEFKVKESFSSDSVINFTGSGGGGHDVAFTSVNVNYLDTIPPVMAIPASISLEATGPTTQVTLTAVTATDAIDGIITATPDKSGPFAVGTHIINWTATDNSNNSVSVQQTIEVTDTTVPSLVAPADQNVDATGPLTQVQIGSATVSDIADAQLAAFADKTGPFAVGTHTITWTAVDASGNTATANQTITVTDVAGPTVTAPEDITKEATASETSVALGQATATDLVDGLLAATADITGPFSVGSHTITWSVTDSSNFEGTDTQTVIITDTVGPTVQAPSAISVAATGENTSLNLGTASASDLVDGDVSVTSDAPASFTVGQHTVTWTATDSKGNIGTATQLVTVSDSDGPSITAPANITAEATGATTAVTLGSATATDTVDGVLTATADKTGPFAIGTHTVTWTATDSSGNKATALQTVEVKDSTSPSLTAPADQSVSATGPETPVMLGSATATDTADAQPTVVADKTGPFAVGIHTITWTATDASGNKATATQTVTVTDTAGPTVIAPADITKEATAAQTAVVLGAATATDLVDGNLNAIADTTGPFSVGSHTITWAVTDSGSVEGTDTQTVIITDTTPPTVIAPNSLSVAATGETTSVDLGTASASDLVDGDVTVTSDAPASFAVGQHTVTWTATDAKGNTGTATQLVTVSDSDGPSITAPANITTEATGATTTVTLGTPTATDVVDGTLTATADNEGPFAVGTHTVTWTAKDSAGNEASAEQTVVVEDTTSPTISVAADVLKIDAKGVSTQISDFGVTAEDLVDGAVTPQAFLLSNGEEIALPAGGLASGSHLLVWKATDAAGNESTANQTIEITPLANFFATQSVSAGDMVTVNVELSGEAVTYPVTIPYTINTDASSVAMDGSDHNAADGSIVIESGTTGSFIFDVSANPVLDGPSGLGKGDLVLAFGELANAAAGSATTHTVMISANNIAPVAKVELSQSNQPVTKVVKDAGAIVISAIATDNEAQTLSYDWSQSDSRLIDLAADTDASTFEVDPSQLAEGTYTATVVVSDNGSPTKETKIVTAFNIVAGTAVIVDTDHDGIEDSKDMVPETNRLPEEEGGTTTYILESQAGTKLKLGDVAIEQGKAAAGVDATGLPEISSDYDTSNLEIYDFEVTGVAAGESVLVVIPQHFPIPADATYLKSDGTSWKPFVEDTNNAIFSAAGTAGVCPSAGDAIYSPGLTAEHLCVQLSIEDGGENDTDGVVNGEVADPGTVVGPANKEAVTYTSTGGSGSAPIFFLPFLLLLGFARRLFSKK